MTSLVKSVRLRTLVVFTNLVNPDLLCLGEFDHQHSCKIKSFDSRGFFKEHSDLLPATLAGSLACTVHGVPTINKHNKMAAADRVCDYARATSSLERGDDEKVS
jgi:hypothetical protein